MTDECIEHDDPFSAPRFPILECLDQRDDQIQAFLDSIPTSLLNAIKPYRRDSFGLLMLLSQNKFLTIGFGKYSTLFWLAFVHAKSESLSKTQFINTCMEEPFAMLRLCNLPANDDALGIIGKFQAETYSQHQYELVYRLFGELDYHGLNKTLEVVPDHLIRFLLQHPECQHLRLLQNLNRYDYPQLVQSISTIQKCAADLELDVASVMLQVTESHDLPALKTLVNALRATYIERMLSDYENELAHDTEACSAFPQPPLASTETIVAITSAAELLQESKLLKHDLVKFVKKIDGVKYYPYRVLEPERATLLLFLFPAIDGCIKPVIKELVTFNGKMADNATLETVKSWLNDQSRHAGNNSQS